MMKYIFCLFFIVLYNPISIYAGDFPVYLNSLEDAIAESDSTKKDILVVFTADWCGYCQVMKKDLSNSQQLLGNTLICYVDVDDNPELKEEYQVKLIPDYFILRKRIEIKRKKGYKNLDDFIKWFKQ